LADWNEHYLQSAGGAMARLFLSRQTLKKHDGEL